MSVRKGHLMSCTDRLILPLSGSEAARVDMSAAGSVARVNPSNPYFDFAYGFPFAAGTRAWPTKRTNARIVTT